MSYNKLDYISRLFQRTSKKRIEHYVISRIWHLLDDYDIKMVPQQYVSREQSKYALTDVYFPQFGFHVEVNEPTHYDSEESINRDNERQNEIENKTGHKVFVIDCRKKLEGIHNQIAQLVSEINSSVHQQKQDGTFKPWKPENEHNPNFWKTKGNIALTDEVSFHTIEDICLLFNADASKTKRGFLRKGGIQHPINQKLLIWWPSERKRSGWVNSFDEINGTIIETHSDYQKRIDHYNYHSKDIHTRIVFYHYKDILGLTNYKFVGVYTNDIEKSNEEIGTVWTRVGEILNLETTEYRQKEKERNANNVYKK
ncbi:MAG: AbaSI family restriction endonuclease [Flavobacteriales bacterium]